MDYQIQNNRGNNYIGRDISQKLKLADVHNHTLENPNNIHSYPAKMFKSIPEVIIPYFSKPGDKILDPFCGSGTVLLEAKLRQRNAIGFDINPLGVLISKVKTSNVKRDKIKEINAKILKNIEKDNAIDDTFVPNKDFWFSKSAQKQLSALAYQVSLIKNISYREFFLLCLSSSVRYASRADPEIVPPVISKRMRPLLKNRRVNVIKHFSDVVKKNAASLDTIKDIKNNGEIEVKLGDARKLKVKARSINLVLTSPPYISAQKYPRSLKLELFWTKLVTTDEFSKIDSETIGTEKVSLLSKFKEDSSEDPYLKKLLSHIMKKNKERYIITKKYFIDMRKVIKEIYRVLAPNGYFVLLIGDNTVCNTRIPNGEILTRYAVKEGFNLITTIEDQIKTFGFMTRRNKTAGIIDREQIIILRKT